jgi:hypothetical protein
MQRRILPCRLPLDPALKERDVLGFLLQELLGLLDRFRDVSAMV